MNMGKIFSLNFRILLKKIFLRKHRGERAVIYYTTTFGSWPTIFVGIQGDIFTKRLKNEKINLQKISWIYNKNSNGKHGPYFL